MELLHPINPSFVKLMGRLGRKLQQRLFPGEAVHPHRAGRRNRGPLPAIRIRYGFGILTASVLPAISRGPIADRPVNENANEMFKNRTGRRRFVQRFQFVRSTNRGHRRHQELQSFSQAALKQKWLPGGPESAALVREQAWQKVLAG